MRVDEYRLKDRPQRYIGCAIDADDHRELKELAAQGERSLSEIVRDAIASYLLLIKQ